MAGTKEGGHKAAITNLAKDPEYYKKIGANGGRSSRTGGFYNNPELAKIANAKGLAVRNRKRVGALA